MRVLNPFVRNEISFQVCLLFLRLTSLFITYLFPVTHLFGHRLFSFSSIILGPSLCLSIDQFLQFRRSISLVDVPFFVFHLASSLWLGIFVHS